MSANRKRLLAGIITAILVWLTPISIAAADPGHWPVWRVALALWPLAVATGCIAATFPFEDTHPPRRYDYGPHS